MSCCRRRVVVVVVVIIIIIINPSHTVVDYIQQNSNINNCDNF